MRVRIDIATGDADWSKGRIPEGLSKIVRSKAAHHQLKRLNLTIFHNKYTKHARATADARKTCTFYVVQFVPAGLRRTPAT